MSGHATHEHPHRVFHRFGRWPLVPVEDLLKLRDSLRQAQELGGPATTGNLLTLVDQELRERGDAPHEELRSESGTGTQ